MSQPARKPTFCSIEVLYTCLLKCRMCKMWKNPRSPGELTIEEWKKFITGLKQFSGSGTFINITGGEPFLKDNVLDLVRHACREGFEEISMTSNGFLVDDRLLPEVRSSGLKMISFSLDSIDPGVHDHLRGTQGCCRKVKHAIDSLAKEKGTIKKIGIQTIVMGPTVDGIPELIAWASEKEVSIYFMAIASPLCVDAGPDWFLEGEYAFLWPGNAGKLNETLDRIIAAKESGSDIGNSAAQLRAFKKYFSNPKEFVKKERKCRMGDGMLKVGPTGELALCGEKGPIGNIRDQGLEEIWFSDKAAQVRAEIASCRSNCPQMINCYFEE